MFWFLAADNGELVIDLVTFSISRPPTLSKALGSKYPIFVSYINGIHVT